LRHRLAELERELAEARATIERLEGREPRRDARIPEGPDWLTGAPRPIDQQRLVERALNPATRRQLEELIRKRLPNAQLTGIGQGLLATLPNAEIRIDSESSGATRVRVKRDNRHVRAQWFVLSALLAVFVNLPLGMYTAALLDPPFWLALTCALATANVLGTRTVVARAQRALRRELVGVWETAATLVHESGEPPGNGPR
jgi:hypothetical protein